MTGYCHSCGHDKPLDNQTKYCDPCYRSIAEQTAANHKRGTFLGGSMAVDLRLGHWIQEMDAVSAYPESWQEADAHPEG